MNEQFITVILVVLVVAQTAVNLLLLRASKITSQQIVLMAAEAIDTSAKAEQTRKDLEEALARIEVLEAGADA